MIGRLHSISNAPEASRAWSSGRFARYVGQFAGRATAVSLFAGLAIVMAACMGSKEVEVAPDERFGHRFEESGPDGRRTVAILPPDSAVSYFYYPAVFDTVHVRPAALSSVLAAEGEVPVEILVKGALPDGCTELNEVSQERYGHIIEMKIDMRRPQGSVCTHVMRPYRFYVRLEGMYEPGSYTLKLNNRVVPFSINPPAAG